MLLAAANPTDPTCTITLVTSTATRINLPAGFTNKYVIINTSGAVYIDGNVAASATGSTVTSNVFTNASVFLPVAGQYQLSLTAVTYLSLYAATGTPTVTLVFGTDY